MSPLRPSLVRVIDRDHRVGRQLVGVADVHVVHARIHDVRTRSTDRRSRAAASSPRWAAPETDRCRSGSWPARRRRSPYSSATASDVQRAVVLRRDVAERLLVDLIEVEPVAAAQHPPPIPRQVVGESDPRRDVLVLRLRHLGVRMPDRLQHQPRRIVRVGSPDPRG